MFAIQSKIKNSVQVLVGIAAGIALSVTVMVSAQQLRATADSAGIQCILNEAIEAAISEKLKTIGITSPDPGKYFELGGAFSCIGPVASVNIDLSRLIPDVLGLLSASVNTAVENALRSANDAVCTAGRKTFGEAIDRYNAARYLVAGGQGMIDARIGAEVENIVSQIASSQKNGSPQKYDILAGINIPNSALPASQAPQQGGEAHLISQNANNATDLTSAAGALESARLNLERARNSRYAGEDEEQYSLRVAQAQRAYDDALARYRQTESQVNTIPTPVAPATVGGSIW